MHSGHVLSFVRDRSLVVIRVDTGAAVVFSAYNSEDFVPGDEITGQLTSLGARTVLNARSGQPINGSIELVDASDDEVQRFLSHR